MYMKPEPRQTHALEEELLKTDIVEGGREGGSLEIPSLELYTFSRSSRLSSCLAGC